MKRTIEIIISPSGEVSIDAIGFKGADCERATAYLQQALGAVATKIKKPEYHSRAMSINQQKLEG